MTHLTNYTFDGARADLSKVLSQAPAFQVTHSFAAGSQGQMGPSPGTYSFGAVYATSQVCMGAIRGFKPVSVGADSLRRCADLYARQL